MKLKKILGLLVLITLFMGCAAKKYKHIPFLYSDNTLNKSRNYIDTETASLNVFVPRKKSVGKLPVLIFVHGGNWNSGSKDTYGFFGRNFAKKGVVTVIPGYTLSPKADYDTMVRQISEAIKWTQNNISKYNGDPNQIFLTGHSAGGHLVTLAAMDPKYGIDAKDISGIILNDAAGLDMKHYLEENPPTEANNYLTTWGSDPDVWQKASPIYYIDKNTPPFLIYLGEKTYPSIKTGNARFLMALQPFQPNVQPHQLNKSHVPMIIQYFWPWSPRFDEITAFMQKQLQE